MMFFGKVSGKVLGKDMGKFLMKQLTKVIDEGLWEDFREEAVVLYLPVCDFAGDDAT